VNVILNLPVCIGMIAAGRGPGNGIRPAGAGLREVAKAGSGAYIVETNVRAGCPERRSIAGERP